MTRWSRLAVLGALLCALPCRPVIAHPLGNFTINHLAIFKPDAGRLRVRYVLDIAEIPTFQIMHASATWTRAQMQGWASEEATRVAAGLSVQANGSALRLALESTSASTRPGAGGLPTLYWTGDYVAPLPTTTSVSVIDGVYADRRVGWKDIILPGLTDPTNALRSYPNASIGSPRHNNRASFDISGGRITRVAVGGQDAASWNPVAIARSSALSDLFSRNERTPFLMGLTVLAAFGLGALHGLEPGHGKALLAFTLVGARATFKQAVILAVALTFAHTIAVVLLGLLLFFATGFATESIFTWITLISGVVVAAIGARSLSRALARATSHAHAHQHGRHHDHDREHAHSHAIAGSAPLHFRTAVAVAMSGGIAPCPAAIVVLLTALHVHRIGYGLFVIVVFSLGLAAILAGLGLAVVRGAAWLQRRNGFSTFGRLAPIVTGVVISIIGATMLAQGFADQGVRLPEIAMVAFTLFVIALFAFVPRHRAEKLQAA